MTRQQLLAEITKRNDTDLTHEEQMRWFVSFQVALELRDYSIKDFARAIYDGDLPTKMDDAGIDAYLASLVDPDLAEPDCDPDAELIETLDDFYRSNRK